MHSGGAACTRGGACAHRSGAPCTRGGGRARRTPPAPLRPGVHGGDSDGERGPPARHVRALCRGHRKRERRVERRPRLGDPVEARRGTPPAWRARAGSRPAPASRPVPPAPPPAPRSSPTATARLSRTTGVSCHREQHVVPRHDGGPVGVRAGRGERVAGGDRGLDDVGVGAVGRAAQALADEHDALGDRRLASPAAPGPARPASTGTPSASWRASRGGSPAAASGPAGRARTARRASARAAVGPAAAPRRRRGPRRARAARTPREHQVDGGRDAAQPVRAARRRPAPGTGCGPW